MIKEFNNLQHFTVLMKIRELAKAYADRAEKTLLAASKRYPKVIFATHVPPFIESTFHEGEISNKDWLPWMCNVTMGDMLVEVAHENPQTEFLILCGHTHSPGTYQALPNLKVETAASMYWYPRVFGTISTQGPMVVEKLTFPA